MYGDLLYLLSYHLGSLYPDMVLMSSSAEMHNHPPALVSSTGDGGGGSKSGGGADDRTYNKSDLVRIECKPPTANILVLQCFRLPSELDQSGLTVY